MLEAIHDQNDFYLVLTEYWLRAVRDPQLRDRLIARRRAAVEQALQVVDNVATALPRQNLLALAQLVVTMSTGVAMEEVLQPGTIDEAMLARLIGALVESAPAADEG